MSKETLGQTVLLVEDDHELRGSLVKGLQEEGFAASAVQTGADALARIEHAVPDVLVIDIGLPDTDGRDLCQALRARGIAAPIIFLTARDQLVDRIAGFDAGGDDYLTKPFAFVELVARLQALLRRTTSDEALEIFGIRLDPRAHTASKRGREIFLSPTEFRVLAALLARPEEVVLRRELIRAGWPLGAYVRQNTLHAYVARLRRKLSELDEPPEITTVHGVGYRLV
jgi:two-component system, OmpR family, response regulator